MLYLQVFLHIAIISLDCFPGPRVTDMQYNYTFQLNICVMVFELT